MMQKLDTYTLDGSPYKNLATHDVTDLD